MAATLLKNVVQSAPTQFSMTRLRDEAHSHNLASTVTVPIQDSNGNPIDATAGTVSVDVELAVDQPQLINPTNAPFAYDAGQAGDFTADVSVSGFCTLTAADSTSTINPGQRIVTVSAIDSAGGTRQVLMQGTLNIQAIP